MAEKDKKPTGHLYLKVVERGAIILFALFLIQKCLSLYDQNRIGPAYKATQAQQFAKPVLIQINNDFTDSSSNAQKYNKNKSADFKKMILDNALKDNDLNTLIKIYDKDPTKINKIYVLACTWNMKYDEKHLTKYGKCLNYYTQQLTKNDQKLVSRYLQKIIDSCNDDPTGVVQKNDLFSRHSSSQIVWHN